MKSILLVSFAWLWTIQASANCPNALVASAEAALKAARNKFGTCRVASVKQVTSWPSEKLESWRVEINCTDHPQRSYSVSLKSCSVTRVQLSALAGRYCGLSDIWGGEAYQPWKFDDQKTLDLRTMPFAELRKLSEHTKAQLRKVAESDHGDIVKVVGYLKDSSEGGEVYVREFEFRGQQFDAVEFYPGGNPYGLIFERGSFEPVASNGDGSISCIEGFRAQAMATVNPTGRRCFVPWGGSISDGTAVRAFRESRVPRGQYCRAEYRRCIDGYLTGSYRHQHCIDYP